MQYIDTANQKRAAFSQQQQADQSQQAQQAMLHELQKLQMATMMGQQKPPVVLTDGTDLGDALRQHTQHMLGAVAALDSTESDQQELMALKDIEMAVETLQRSTNTDFSELIQAVRSLDMTPNVTVPAPKVTVQSKPVDFTPLTDKLETLLAPETEKVDLDEYRAQDLKEDGDIQYIGFVNPKGNWYIIENNVTKNTMRYLFGTADYQKHFKNAASYVYKLLNEAVDDTV